MQRSSYRKPVKTGKPNPISAVKPGSIDDLMRRYDETIRTAKKERQSSVLFEATVQINDVEEGNLFDAFLEVLVAYRKDPFAVNAEAENLATLRSTQAKMKFDELVPADDPPEATAGPTWAPQHTQADVDRAVATILALEPTEDEAVEAFKKYAAKHSSAESVALVQSYKVARVKEIQPAMRAAFIAECVRGG